MTRQTSLVMILVAIIAFFGFAIVSNIYASEHQWTSLDGPYWANGIDVAYGVSGNGQAWHRYLAGSDGTTTKLFRWRETDAKWFEWNPLAGANRLISYKKAGSGHFAVCSAYDDDIRMTVDGGINWTRMFFPEQFNTHFSSVEIVNWAQNPGHTVVVGTEYQADQPSAYYTDNYGGDWFKLGAVSDPLDGRDVLDIETLPDEGTYPVMTAGTVNGLYKHSGDWSTQWTLEAFSGLEVRVLESLDRWVDSESQVAAVDDNGTWKLYLTTDAWDTAPSEIKPGGQSFDKEPHDIGAIYWGGVNDKISCHVATTEGVYILHFSANDPGNATEIDLKSDEDYGYKPMRYDKNITSVDYLIDSWAGVVKAIVVASTPYNVYEIEEGRLIGRDFALVSIFTLEIPVRPL